MNETIGFDTMSVNCIQIYQEVYELFAASNHLGIKIDLKVETVEELKTNPTTKTWDGMGRYAKWLYDDNEIWNKLPEQLTITLPHNNVKKEWQKWEARKSLLDCFNQLGGEKLFAVK